MSNCCCDPNCAYLWQQSYSYQGQTVTASAHELVAPTETATGEYAGTQQNAATAENGVNNQAVMPSLQLILPQGYSILPTQPKPPLQQPPLLPPPLQQPLPPPPPPPAPCYLAPPASCHFAQPNCRYMYQQMPYCNQRAYFSHFSSNAHEYPYYPRTYRRGFNRSWRGPGNYSGYPPRGYY